MRLIDADALLEVLKANCGTLCNDKNTDWCEYCCPHNDFEDLIDNAPTVKPFEPDYVGADMRVKE